MAQLSSAQREPSMEEILASIRRIIEDSDLPKPTAAAAPSVEARAEVAPAFDHPTYQEFEALSRVQEEAAPIIEPTIVPPAANEDRPGAAIDFGREPDTDVLNTAEQRIEPESVAPQMAASVETLDWNLGVTDEAVIDQLSEADFDLAEVADAVLKELSDEQAAETGTVALEAPSAQFKAMAAEFDAPAAVVREPADASPVASAAEFDSLADAFDLDAAAMEASTAAVFAAHSAEEPQIAKAGAYETDAVLAAALDEPMTSVVEQAAAALTLANISEAQRSAIISEEAGRQVTASFSELAEAFASRGRKSLDEVAEDLMRPMLQDWLDNNLPTMVERLVREEIERVARGTGA
jgi:cell pole-organizing protein PopZ